MPIDFRLSGGAGCRHLYNRGQNFPLEDAELRGLMQHYLLESEPDVPVPCSERVTALMSPHIDHGRGCRVYASCARVLDQLPAPDVIVLMGTHHKASSRWLFHLDNRWMATPLGLTPCAMGAAARLKQLYPGLAPFRSAHAALDQEWSLEMPLPILQHRFRDESMPPVLPIAIGWMGDLLEQRCPPSRIASIRKFILALGQLIAEMCEDGLRVLIWNGVDFSHVGLWHGDSCWQLDRVEPEVIEHDTNVLKALNAGDEQELFELFAADNNKFRSDVFEPLYIMLSALRAATGSIPAGTTIDYALTGRIETFQGRELDNIVSFGASYWQI